MPQTKTDTGVLLDRFRARDWDYLGWRYSLLSSIATGGWNNVLNMIPARDLEEHQHFAQADQAWFRRWLDWTSENKEYLRHTRAILDQPALGKVDGTSAIVGNRGFVFLFNPNARRLRAELTLDASIGLEGAGPYVLRELYPLEGRLVGKPGAGAWSLAMRSRSRWTASPPLVLEVEPVQPANEPLLFNAPGSASLSEGVLSLSDVAGRGRHERRSARAGARGQSRHHGPREQSRTALLATDTRHRVGAGRVRRGARSTRRSRSAPTIRHLPGARSGPRSRCPGASSTSSRRGRARGRFRGRRTTTGPVAGAAPPAALRPVRRAGRRWERAVANRWKSGRAEKGLHRALAVPALVRGVLRGRRR